MKKHYSSLMALIESIAAADGASCSSRNTR